jgi:hypothetical protein
VKRREICKITIKIKHKTQSQQRHFTCLNMAKVENVFWHAFEGFHHLIRSANEMIRNFTQKNIENIDLWH